MSWMRREMALPTRTVPVLLLIAGLVTASFCHAAVLYPEVVTLLEDDTVQLLLPADATPPFVWSSTDTNIIQVDAEGLATAIAPGLCRLRTVDSLETSYTTGIYTVAHLEAAPANTSVAGDTTAFAVDITADFSDWNIDAFEFTLGFDAVLLEYVDVTSEGTLSEAWGSPEINELQPGRIRVAHAGTSSLNSDGAFLQFSLRLREAYGTGTEIPVSLISIRCNEGSPLVKGGTGLITVGEPAYVDSVLVTPTMVELYLEQDYTFTAFVATNGDTGVTWSVLEGADAGTISADGVYSAPAILPAPPTATVTATVSLFATETAGALTLVALKNPGHPRSLQVFVSAATELMSPPQATLDGTTIDLTAVGEATNSYLGSIILDPTVTSATITASGTTAEGEISQQIVVSY